MKFPSRVRQTAGGHPVLDLAIKEVQPNAAVTALAVPDAVRAATTERVTNEKVAEGVWHIAGGSHNSVLIEMSDHLVLVEAPLEDGRTKAVIDHVKALVANKPIRYVINSHAHFDHSGGLRAAVAEGATIVTMAGNVAHNIERLKLPVERILPLHGRVVPLSELYTTASRAMPAR